MKIAVVGAGAVGAAVTTCLVHQGQAEHIVLIDTNTARAHAPALDLGHGTPLTPPVNLYAGNHDDAHNADLVLICAGRNERTGGATDRCDPLAQCVLRKERRVLPVASPSVMGTGGVEHVLHPPMSQDEHHNLHARARALRTATHHLHS